MATRLKPTRINVDNTPRVGDGAAYQNDNDFHWSMGGGDMSYRDFEWNTLTGNSITIEDISNNITPSSNFTVYAGTELKPGIEYVLRVNTGNTPYTMTLGTGVVNPNSYKTELKPNTVNQFKFIATSTSQLELEGVDSAIVSEINWGEIGGTLSNQTDLQNALNLKANATDVNTKTFYISNTSDTTNAQAAIDWYLSGKNPLIIYKNFTHIYSGPIALVGTDKGYHFTRDGGVVGGTGDSSGVSTSGIQSSALDIITNSSDIVTQISFVDKGFRILPTDSQYPVQYAPQEYRDPVNKKYVDDKVTASAIAPSYPAEGMLWYDTTNGVLKVYNGNSWDTIATGGAISDTAYGPGWDGQTTTAPSQNAVYDKISSIDALIPSEATSSNKLADKAFVGDSINSVTAYYITKNANGDQFATYAELAAATTFYSGGVVRVPTKNDYTIVLSDENHGNATTRYIYNNGWEYQYTVNETAMTQAQLNALNSGITAGKVSTYDGYATGKQDTLVSGTNIKTINNQSLLGNGDIAINGILSGPLTPTASATYAGRIWFNTTDNKFWKCDGTAWTEVTPVLSVNGNTGVVTVQETLVSGTNIKTVNSTSLLGSGNINIGGDVQVSSQSGNILTSGMKIRAGTETDYGNLGTYDNNTVYLTI